MTIDKYLDKLAARKPVPGGGSAAALVGSLGMSLLSMTAQYAARKTGKGASHGKLLKIIRFSETARRRLRKLMREDEAAYLKLSSAMRSRSAKRMAKLYKNAALVPLEVCEIAREGIKKCAALYPNCSISIVSDLIEAVILLEAAYSSAKLNVMINLPGIKNKALAKKIRNSLRKKDIR
jgi:formiminotetrahydrofolate cyclodeaminase